MRIHHKWLCGLACAGLVIGCGPGGEPGAGAVGSERSELQITTTGPGGRWLYTFTGGEQYGSAYQVLALTADPSGATIALVVDGSYPPPSLLLRKLDSSGFLIWERAFQGTTWLGGFDGLGTDASGNIYILWDSWCADMGCGPPGTIDFGGGPTPYSALVKLSPTGQFIRQTDLGNHGVQALAVNASGEAVFVGYISPYFRWVEKVRADGTIAWRRDAPGFLLATIDPSGNALVSGLPGQPFFGTPMSGLGVAKLAASDGANVWVNQLAAAEGWVTGIGTSALGTVVVAAGISGPFSFAGQSLDAGSYLLVLESTGEQRFARMMPGGAALAVDPSGKVSQVGSLGGGHFAVTWYNLAGDLLGQLEFPAGPIPEGDLGPNSVAIASDHSTVIGGKYASVTSGSTFGAMGPVVPVPGSPEEVWPGFIVGGLFRLNSPSFSEYFNRTSLGPNWRVAYGSYIDNGWAAVATAPQSYAFWTGAPGRNDTVQIVVSRATYVGITLRGQSVPDRDHYAAYVDPNGRIAIARRRGYVYSYLGTGPAFPSGLHAFAFTATGTNPVTLKVQVDGNTVLTATDSSSSRLTAAGKVGIFDYNGTGQPITEFEVYRRAE